MVVVIVICAKLHTNEIEKKISAAKRYQLISYFL